VNGETVEIRLNIFRARIRNTLHGFTANSWRIPSVLGAALAASISAGFLRWAEGADQCVHYFYARRKVQINECMISTLDGRGRSMRALFLR
jgi:hypothetical protein